MCYLLKVETAKKKLYILVHEIFLFLLYDTNNDAVKQYSIRIESYFILK